MISETVEDKGRVGVCFDTCHAFAAGYDFRTKKAYGQLVKEFDKIISIERINIFKEPEKRDLIL